MIVFVTDGLRSESVNATDSPTLLRIRQRGVFFSNSHSLFPTFTTANAAAIATGHHLGDTGDFSNTLYSGYPIFNSGNFGKTAGTVTPFIEDDTILADLDSHYSGNYLDENTLLCLARANGYATASIGKRGPAAIQDVSQLNPTSKNFPIPSTVFLDDDTGSAGIPLSSAVQTALTDAQLGTKAPPRGANGVPPTQVANVDQQKWFADATTKAILPMFKKNGNPFVLVFWSRDPDGTQHFQGDSLNSLTPGINGPTSRAGVKNADDNLKQILDYIEADEALKNNTDIFVTADHGFATISKHEIDASGNFTKSYATGFTYKKQDGTQEVATGFLPVGFLAIDIAHALGLPLYDPDTPAQSQGRPGYKPVDPTIPQETAATLQHPKNGNGLIGGTGIVLDVTDAKVIVAANGGSDLVYIPDRNRETLSKLVLFLQTQDYVGGLFVDEDLARPNGTLSLKSIDLTGSTKLPKPSIAVTFKTFATDASKPRMTGVQIADTTLQEGQGMHGALSSDNTFNGMAAIGPDFRKGFVDDQPVGNADVPRTLAYILGFSFTDNGKLAGRVITEALAKDKTQTRYTTSAKVLSSRTGASGKRTILLYQRYKRQMYLDSACFVDAHASGSKGNPCQ